MKPGFGVNPRLEPKTGWGVETGFGTKVWPGTNPGPGVTIEFWITVTGARVKEGFATNVVRVTVAGACVGANAAGGCAMPK